VGHVFFVKARKESQKTQIYPSKSNKSLPSIPFLDRKGVILSFFFICSVHSSVHERIKIYLFNHSFVVVFVRASVLTYKSEIIIRTNTFISFSNQNKLKIIIINNRYWLFYSIITLHPKSESK
jgi:hypothetical protein